MEFRFNSSGFKERFSVSFFFFISGFTFSTWASRIPELQTELKLNDAELGALLILLPAGLIITMPLTAYLLSKFTSRSIMLVSSLVYVCLLSFLGMFHNIWIISCILFLFGASRNLFNLSINTQAIGVQNLISRPIMASFHGIWSIAGFLGVAFASFLISLDFDIKFHFNLISLFSFILIVLNYKNTLISDNQKATKNLSLLFPDKALLRLGFIAFFCMASEAIMSEWGVIYFIKVVHAPKEYTTFGYMAYLSSMTLGRFIGDMLTKRFGPVALLKGGALLSTIGLLITIVFPYLVMSVLGYFLIGLGLSCLVPLIYSLAGKNSNLSVGPAITSISTIGYVGYLSGPSLIGLISYLVNMRISFILVICSTLAVFLLSSRVKS